MALAQGSGYCRSHRFEVYVQTKALNRYRGLCRCGARPVEGRTARGKPYRTCGACLALDQAARAVRKAARHDAKAALMRLPRELRYYGLVLGAMMHDCEEARRIEVRRERLPGPVFHQLPERQQRFVKLYAVTKNGARSARGAGYAVASSLRGGGAAAVAAHRLLKKPLVRQAVFETEQDAARLEAELKRLEAEAKRRAMRRRTVEEIININHLEVRGAQSTAARLQRWARGLPMLRVPGCCRCGARASEGRASCAPCRSRRAEYQRRWRKAE